MNCEQAQNDLSEFLDRTVSSEVARTLREHLAACPRCSEELAELAEGRRLITNLAELDPPVGLVTRVMADVRAVASRPSIWQRLFYPLRVKVPLQATAVLLIGLLSIYVYQTQSLQMTASNPALPTPSPSQKQDFTTREHSPPASNSPAGRTSETRRKNAQGNEAAGPPIAGRPDLVVTQQNSTTANLGVGATDRRPEPKPQTPRSAPIPSQGVSALREGFSRPTEFDSRAPLPPIEAMRSREALTFSDERQFSFSRELVPDYEFVVRRRTVSSVHSAISSRVRREDLQKRGPEEAARESSDAQEEKASRPQEKNGSTIEILWFSVPRERYEDFKKELTAQSIIESETPVAIKQKDPSFSAGRPLSIKVTVFDPAK